MRGFLVVVAAALTLAGCGGDETPPAPESGAAPKDGVKELTNVLDLRSDFEADAGRPRVILLLSPT
ncbi:MAG: hypothetical protein WKF65_15975 [Gaiellaceae bacterium]